MVQQLSRNKIIPTLSRESLEPEDKEDNEAWRPRWKCFCCHDTGIINGNLVRLVIPDYKALSDKRPLCQRCDISDRYHSDDLPEYIAASHDYRFTREICDQLNQFEKENWDNTLKLWHEKRQQGVNPHAEVLQAINSATSKIGSIAKNSKNPDDDVDF